MFIANAYVFHPRQAFRKNNTNASSVACATSLSINREHRASIINSTSFPSAPSSALFANISIASFRWLNSSSSPSSCPWMLLFFLLFASSSLSSNSLNAFSISPKYSFVASSNWYLFPSAANIEIGPFDLNSFEPNRAGASSVVIFLLLLCLLCLLLL